jgi:NADH-quinone oxidoreductase subunit G
MVNVTGRLQRLNQATQPTGSAMEDWEIIRDLTLAINGETNSIYMIEDVLKMIAADVTEFNGITFSKIGDLGIQLLETGVEIPLLTKERERAKAGLIVG